MEYHIAIELRSRNGGGGFPFLIKVNGMCRLKIIFILVGCLTHVVEHIFSFHVDFDCGS